MLNEVIAFALIISLFEFVIIVMITPRLRLRALGTPYIKMLFHIGMLCLNLWVHWGTVVGTMSATLSFICSLGVIHVASAIFGRIENSRYYTVGWVKYSIEEIK